MAEFTIQIRIDDGAIRTVSRRNYPDGLYRMRATKSLYHKLPGLRFRSKA